MFSRDFRDFKEAYGYKMQTEKEGFKALLSEFYDEEGYFASVCVYTQVEWMRLFEKAYSK